MNLIFIICALVCCLLAFFVDGLYVRGFVVYKRRSTKLLFLNLMFFLLCRYVLGF